MRRRPGPLTAVSACVACALLAAAPVPAQEKWKKLPPPAQAREPVDPAIEAMKREMEARAKEHRDLFEKLKAIEPAALIAPVAPAPPAPFPPAAVVFDANVANQAQRYTGQFRAILKAEYQLLLTVCGPTKEQRREIARAGESALKAAATQVSEWQRSPQRRVVVAGNQASGMPDPRKVIQDKLAAAARAQLSPGQVARYIEEVERRAADERRVMVSNLVAKLDQSLYLSDEQRDRLGKSLAENWNDSWGQSLQVFMYNDTYFPPIPDKFLDPILTPSQRGVWAGVTKILRTSWGGFLPGMVDENPLEDAELGPAGAAGP
jgi:hypothetical protein